MTNETTSHHDLARLQDVLFYALADLRCIRDMMANAQGCAGLPDYARISFEGVLNRLEGVVEGESVQ